MKKILIVSLILTACIFLSGCSAATEFVVINKSDSPVEVEYTLNLNLKALDNPTTKPLKMKLSVWNSWFEEKSWKEVPDNEFVYNAETQKCKLKLLPDEVLRITFVDYSSFTTVNEYQNFRIVGLRLAGKYGEVFYNGNQIYNQFEKKNSQNYYIAYEQVTLSERNN